MILLVWEAGRGRGGRTFRKGYNKRLNSALTFILLQLYYMKIIFNKIVIGPCDCYLPCWKSSVSIKVSTLRIVSRLMISSSAPSCSHRSLRWDGATPCLVTKPLRAHRPSNCLVCHTRPHTCILCVSRLTLAPTAFTATVREAPDAWVKFNILSNQDPVFFMEE